MTGTGTHAKIILVVSIAVALLVLLPNTGIPSPLLLASSDSPGHVMVIALVKRVSAS